ncbi:unnamed protein product [Urochloa decumbens]|uniref:DUF1618 domain-containing protein n=1 Tax=Urochloa decumbens TaxID=240449 RepID=A0ABC9ANR2_9POAL
MKRLTRRLALLGRFNGNALISFRGPSSIGLRSIHLAPTTPAHPSSESSAPATDAAKDPRWVLLPCRDSRRDDDGSLVTNAKTMAEARTSMGQHLRISFELAAPPASSFLYYNYDCDGDGYPDPVNVVAADGDSVLLMVSRGHRDASSMATYDHFVYRAGGAAGRPPSLTLLPARNIPKNYEVDGTSQGLLLDPYSRALLEHDTGVLRRGEDDLVVAQLEVMSGDNGGQDVADICVLRLGMSQWEHKRSVPIIVHGEDDELIDKRPDMATAVGDRFLCWFCYSRGLIVWDMVGEERSPKLQYVPLPVLPYDPSYYTDDLPPLSYSQNVGAAGRNAVRFINIEPRCCCGGFGRTSCARSRFAFTVTTWTLTLTIDGPMKWVKDAVLDCEELWALPGYEGLPRVHLECPIVSLDNPDIVCFKVNGYYENDKGSWKIWMIQVDTRNKALLSAVEYTDDAWKTTFRIPAKL